MEFLNWMAEHWLLTIVLAGILSGAVRATLVALIVAVTRK